MHGLEVDSREADPDARRIDPRLRGATRRTAGQPTVERLLAEEAAPVRSANA